MPTLTINLSAAQKAALTTSYNNLTQFVDSADFQKAISLLRRMDNSHRTQVLDSYPRLKLLVELGEKLRIE